MSTLFYAASAIAIISAILMVTRRNAMHALLYLLVTIISMSAVFYTLGAPFAAALQIVVYAGAIMVLFVFALMMLNITKDDPEPATIKAKAMIWAVPMLLSGALLGFFLRTLIAGREAAQSYIGPKVVGAALFTDYLIGVEIASVLLLAGLVAAVHVGIMPGRKGGSDE